jgi:hypothetical protein
MSVATKLAVLFSQQEEWEIQLIISLLLKELAALDPVRSFLLVAPSSDIEKVTNFCVFYKAFMLKGLWHGIFFKFGDKGLLSCTEVVIVNS